MRGSAPLLVSVIMSMRNSAATVEAAARSVLVQSLPNLEFIVIDDGSHDQSSLIIESFGDPRIRLVREPQSAGLATRLNQAVALAKGEFIARMDADDICFPDRLARQVARLRERPLLDVLGCRAAVFRNDGALIGELPVGRSHRDVTAHPFVGFPLPHPTWCGRADWFRSHRYDDRLRYAEDQDLLLRSFRDSTFGGLDAVLLAYRQDGLSLKKLLPGRATFVKSVWRNKARPAEVWSAMAGSANQVAKGMVDIATIGFGLKRWMQFSRLRPVSPGVAQEWHQLRQTLGVASAPGNESVG